MTRITIPPLDPDLLARRARLERETADSAEAQALMDPIFPAMRACSDYLDSLGLIWGKDYELLAHNLVALLDFASNTFSIKLGAADLPAVDPNGRALLDTLAAAMRVYADFALRRGLIWDPARQALAVTSAYGITRSASISRFAAVPSIWFPTWTIPGQTLCGDRDMPDDDLAGCWRLRRVRKRSLNRRH